MNRSTSRQHEPMVITSLQNDRVKAIRALDMRKERKATGLFVAEGASIIFTARENGWMPQTLVARENTLSAGVVTELSRWVMQAGGNVMAVSEAVLAKLSSKENPQSVLGVFKQRHAPLPDPRSLGTGDVVLVLEEVRDPGNLGTIMRTVDAVGAKAVILVGQCCDPWSRECVRATMGSIFAVPISRASHDGYLEWSKAWPGDVVATHLAGTEDFRMAHYRAPSLLMMGSEGPGLSDQMAAVATRKVKIPMAGRLDSLNLAVATALVLYQMRGSNLKLGS
ncbi:MAG: RNA methyltransferase [Hyphomicrobiaceae bacterium]|nr:RNA methyltransferase [Hyphomicrobiaceae bacterium]